MINLDTEDSNNEEKNNARTPDNQLSSEVDSGGLVCGDASVRSAAAGVVFLSQTKDKPVGGAKGEEEDVAAEDVILHLVAG